MQDNERTVVIGDPAALGAVSTRRRFLRALGMGGSIVLLPSVFAACEDSTASLVSPEVAEQYESQQAVVLNLNTDVGILNYAYALEQLEAGFYQAVLAAPAFAGLSAEEREILTDLRDHEVIHREFLRVAIPNDARIRDLRVDFTAALANRDAILQAARGFEDLGVAAYNGAGRFLTSPDFLTIAGKIVSVEARHAAAIRDLLTPNGLAFATFSTDELRDLGANNAQALDGALEPRLVLEAVGRTGVLRTNITIGTAPVAPA